MKEGHNIIKHNLDYFQHVCLTTYQRLHHTVQNKIAVESDCVLIVIVHGSLKQGLRHFVFKACALTSGLQIIFFSSKDICPTKSPFWSDKTKMWLDIILQYHSKISEPPNALSMQSKL